MRNLFTWAAARIVAAFALALPFAAIAEVQMTNPVTGETETYENIFVGTSGEWNSADNWTLKETGKVPFVSDGNYDPAVVTGQNVTAETPIDGWTLRVGAYNNARIFWAGDNVSGGITKIQSDTIGGNNTGCWLTADETSLILIDSFAGEQLEGSDSAPFKLSSAKANGIVWVNGITNASNTTLPFWYYLKGNGTVAYNGPLTVANAQVIKQADITLSGTLQVASKTLVTFGFGTTKAFSADASIKVKNANGDVVRTVPLTSVTAAEGTTLTTDDHVGSCELVQTSTGIVLYYVDGDPENLPVYKPSININFTNRNGLTTARDVGLAGYEVPGTSWNNFVVANNAEFSVVSAVSSNGDVSVEAGVSVAISGTRGDWICSGLTSASNLLYCYIDEDDNNPTPTVTVSGIPYYKYRVLVYHSTDTANVPFGYDTINGTNYTYVNDALAEGTAAWGSSGAKDSANAISEGGNVLVTGELSGSTLTVVGHRGGGANNARGCIAAIQIIEVPLEVSEGDLEIPVSGDTTYTVSEGKTLPGAVYITGRGTLTLDGAAKITADTIYVGLNVTLNIDSNRLDGASFTGGGTVVYNGSLPDTTKGFDDSSAWTGTVWVKNIGSAPYGETSNTAVTLGTDTFDASNNELNYWGNANSYVKFTNVRGHMATATCAWTLILEDGADTYAWYNNNGWTGRNVTIAALEGDGTFYDKGNSGCRQNLTFMDVSKFTGSFNISGKRIGLGGNNTADNHQDYRGTIEVVSGTTATVASGKTWTTGMGFRVYGTINATGTLAADSTATACAVGTGTVVFVGKEPTTGDAWWKNAAWTGTVEIRGATLAKNIHLADYGNTESKVCMNGTTAYLYVVAHSGNHNVKELVIGANGFTQNGSYSSGAVSIVLPCKLTGTGTYSWAAGGSATKTVFLTGDTSEFNGKLSPSGTSCRFVVGETSRDFVAGSVVVGSNKVLKIATGNTSYGGGLFVDEGGRANITGFYWSAAGVTADGVVSVTSLNGNLGGGTAVRLGDTGVLEVTRSDSPSADDGATDYARVTGTGTIRFAGSGFTVVSSKFPTDLTFDAEKDSGSVVPVAGATIGSLMGDKGFRSDWGQGGRYLTIKQSKNTVWNGSINVDGAHRLTGVVVDPGESTTGTLTMTATQTATSTLAVNGSVNLAGTWVGATTVAGTFGGTGTLTGDLTFAEGSTFKVWESDVNGLAVSGTITYPETGTVTVDVSDIETTGGNLVILTASDANVTVDADKFALADGTGEGYSLSVNDAGNLVLTAPAAVGAIAPTDNPAAYTIYQTTEQVIAALAGLSGMQTLTVTGTFAADSVTVQSGLTLTVSVMGGSVSVGTFNVAGSLILTANSVSSTAVVLTDAAASCTVNSTLVESVSVTSGVEGKVVSKSEDTNPVYTLVDAPSDTYEITSETTLGEGGTLNIGSATKIKIGTYDVTAGFSIDGATATLRAPEFVEETDKKAIDVGATTVTLNVDLVPGLYYGVASGTGLTLTRPETLTQCTGSNDADILTVTKPSAEKGFFKVFVDIKE